MSRDMIRKASDLVDECQHLFESELKNMLADDSYSVSQMILGKGDCVKLKRLAKSVELANELHNHLDNMEM